VKLCSLGSYFVITVISVICSDGEQTAACLCLCMVLMSLSSLARGSAADICIEAIIT
jgi:hypothetical protein